MRRLPGGRESAPLALHFPFRRAAELGASLEDGGAPLECRDGADAMGRAGTTCELPAKDVAWAVRFAPLPRSATEI